jgi:hypothetical protein
VCRKHEGLEAAIELCRNNKVKFNFERTANQHFKFYIEGVPKYVLIGGGNMICINKVRRDIKRALEHLTG